MSGVSSYKLVSSFLHFPHPLPSPLRSLLPQTLQAHYAPAVSGLVKRVLSPDTSNPEEEELSKYLDITHEQVIYIAGILHA